MQLDLLSFWKACSGLAVLWPLNLSFCKLGLYPVSKLHFQKGNCKWAQGDVLRHLVFLCYMLPPAVGQLSCVVCNSSGCLHKEKCESFQPSPSSLVFLIHGYYVPLAWEQIYLMGFRKSGIGVWGSVLGGTEWKATHSEFGCW